MISDNDKKTIDDLPKEELLEEINKRNLSRFQGKKYAYLKTRLAFLTQQENNEVRQEDVAYKKEELALAREANQLSHKANNLSKTAIWVSVLAVLIALGALIFEICSGGKCPLP
ncbi:TPA: hypothetical protein JBL19_09715 [Legionella pneumophila]|uniref:hypothetical protein n=1 Tax=Legionella pneumophila TaxID=446 RepID=UPI001374E043|nr:hypothetical protein [Legionella pneumophila]HAT1796907.1 hypothetical protein [Legionella pneumophila]HAT1904526.1 hypothetical protein [Legionella pneumophila]HAT2149844.1 hypothetical protein [Legionella pneumophila]HAT3984115.1 hypothetical protein [Legionella pneumophila]HAT7749218.1 hypothetical protein [Legionella pneumophila]